MIAKVPFNPGNVRSKAGKNGHANGHFNHKLACSKCLAALGDKPSIAYLEKSDDKDLWKFHDNINGRAQKMQEAWMSTLSYDPAENGLSMLTAKARRIIRKVRNNRSIDIDDMECLRNTLEAYQGMNHLVDQHKDTRPPPKFNPRERANLKDIGNFVHLLTDELHSVIVYAEEHLLSQDRSR